MKRAKRWRSESRLLRPSAIRLFAGCCLTTKLILASQGSPGGLYNATELLLELEAQHHRQRSRGPVSRADAGTRPFGPLRVSRPDLDEASDGAAELQQADGAREKALRQLWYKPFEERPPHSATGRGGRPLVAIVSSSTSRGLDRSMATLDQAPLFAYLLPSIARTVEQGYDYLAAIAYDVGDPFYDSLELRREVRAWFQTNIMGPARTRGISVELKMVRVNNVLSKPGPAFLAAARYAYDRGADYMLRVNDDTEMQTPWASKFIRAMEKLGPPYGVIGPDCKPPELLVHDFTHRTHMEIFNGYYYPPELTDWWLDKWVSQIYGNQRTIRALNVLAQHHLPSANKRYSVTHENKLKVPWLLARDTFAIGAWMAKHPDKVPEGAMRSFLNDTFDGMSAMEENGQIL